MPDQLPKLSDADADVLRFAKALVADEAAAVANLASLLDAAFIRAVDLIVACADSGGTVLVTGLGKSGLVGGKISATMASLGIPSHAVHPSEAFHGDLGRFRSTDTVICISSSGETDEVVSLAAVLKQDGLPVISITGRRGGDPTSLERLATVSLTLGVTREAGEGFIAPTSSTTATMALGDALALASARRRNFTHEDFKRRHPGGSLGELLRPVTEVLRFVVGKTLPLVSDTLTVAGALAEASRVGRRPGALTLVDSAGRLSGIFTDGDLRRLILRDTGELSRPIREVMTTNPRTLRDDARVQDAVKMFREFRQDEIPVVDAAGKPIGILDVQDLMAMRLVQD
ncbi:MAG: KpsF/GutQ family sugar-phosphate isomerase [Planctomycetes bacterium]|nr:KpsF/GutQ family sugar-phosphate isomerase [Planctomycetota bacterium]